jgi:hypothetical protein
MIEPAEVSWTADSAVAMSQRIARAMQNAGLCFGEARQHAHNADDPEAVEALVLAIEGRSWADLAAADWSQTVRARSQR